MRKFILGVLLSLSATGFSAEPSPSPVPSIPASKSFSFRLTGEPETLDWNKAHTTMETYLLMNLMEGLVAFDDNLKVVPALAENWKVTSNGAIYTFKLRKDIVWSDGVPLKAQDFVYSWKRLLTPSTAASYAYLLFDVEGAEGFNRGSVKNFNDVGVKALDDQTLQVTLARPVAHWLFIPTFWVTFPLRQDLVEKHGETAWANPGKMVTVGPYLLHSRETDAKIVLRANPRYRVLPMDKKSIEEVVALIIRDDATALNLYETGKLDLLTDVSSVDLKRLQGRPDLKTFPYLKTAYLGFVIDKHPLNLIQVRRAIAMAIDKSQFGNLLYGGQQAATSFVPPPMMAYSPKLGLPFDPARAKQEIAGLKFDPVKPLTIQLITPNFEKSLTVAQFIQGEIKKNLGIEIEIQPFDNKTFRAQQALKIHPLFLGSWSADYPDPDNFLSVFLRDSGNNRTNWRSERGKFDEWILGARVIRKEKVREAAYLDAQKTLLEEDVVILPLYYEPNTALIRPRVQGLKLDPLNNLLLRKVRLEN